MPAIKSWFTGETILEYEGDLATALVEAVQKGKLLSGANLSRANLICADLSGADLSRANLICADLSGADLIGANLSRANLIGANLSRANLSRANLIGADLSGADLSRANLIGANLSRANLSRANLIGADLSGADLSRANLICADLSGADLIGANLSRANLSRANLSGANLSADQKIIMGAARSDGHCFRLTSLNDRGWRVQAGCRDFSLSEAREHWQQRAGTQLGEETFAIIENMIHLAKIRGWAVDGAKPAAKRLAVKKRKPRAKAKEGR